MYAPYAYRTMTVYITVHIIRVPYCKSAVRLGHDYDSLSRSALRSLPVEIKLSYCITLQYQYLYCTVRYSYSAVQYSTVQYSLTVQSDSTSTCNIFELKYEYS